MAAIASIHHTLVALLVECLVNTSAIHVERQMPTLPMTLQVLYPLCQRTLASSREWTRVPEKVEALEDRTEQSRVPQSLQ